MCHKLIPFSLTLLLCMIIPVHAGVQAIVAPPLTQAVIAPQAQVICPSGYTCERIAAVTTEVRVSPMSGPVEEIERDGLFKRFKARRSVLVATKELRRGSIDAVFLRESQVVQSIDYLQRAVVVPLTCCEKAVIAARVQVIEPPVVLVEEGATGKN